MTSRLTLTTVTLGAPDPRVLAHFYQRLLGWEISVESPDWVTLPDPSGGVGLAFQTESNHTPPVWPDPGPTDQQMQVHLEIRVDDLETAGAHARTCGATLAGVQPQEKVRVYKDPAGHPFCLWVG
ncbi:VOC family protein [Phytoactinopolyspora limicola]|uniref:VOC family protein n=1 Tax=Phytoactinopolyspora limicola TaxID=2715536 RepID=UPI0014076B5E|nr:VOC family protein [Phytoactinopolyspora limicola]